MKKIMKCFLVLCMMLTIVPWTKQSVHAVNEEYILKTIFEDNEMYFRTDKELSWDYASVSIYTVNDSDEEVYLGAYNVDRNLFDLTKANTTTHEFEFVYQNDEEETITVPLEIVVHVVEPIGTIPYFDHTLEVVVSYEDYVAGNVAFDLRTERPYTVFLHETEEYVTEYAPNIRFGMASGDGAVYQAGSFLYKPYYKLDNDEYDIGEFTNQYIIYLINEDGDIVNYQGKVLVELTDRLQQEYGSTMDAIKMQSLEGTLPSYTILNAEKVEETDSSITYDITLMADFIEVQPVGDVEVTVTLPESLQGKDVEVVYVDENNEEQVVTSSYTETEVTFTTNHFSTYKIQEAVYECEHVWKTEYTIDKEATVDSEGMKSIHCDLCDAVQEGSEVVIPKLEIPLESLVLNYEMAVLQVEEFFTLSVTANPSNTTDSLVYTWSSSDENVVTVLQNGYVKAVGSGEATITVTTPSGVSAECYVYVYTGPYDELEQIKRIYGDNRYETSFEIGMELMRQMDVDLLKGAIIANGTNFADALAGSYLSAKYNAPILMTNNKNHNDVMMYLLNRSNSSAKTYLLGGTAAIKKVFDTSLTGFEYDYKRLAGNNRYETNLEILYEGKVTNEPILVCTGSGFADSLSASATGYPILLVSNTLSSKQKEFLSSLNGNEIIIIGGTSAVSTSIEKQLQAYGKVERLAGSNRYETSVMVAERFFDHPEYVVLAYARNFPDGLSGGPLAYYKQAPLILTDNNNWKVAADYVQENEIVSGAVLGGPTLISSDTVKKIFNTQPNIMETCTINDGKYYEAYGIVSNKELVLAMKYSNTVVYESGIELSNLQSTAKKLKNQIDSMDGIEYSYGQNAGEFYEELYIDYEIVDFNDLVRLGLIEKVDGMVPDYVDYELTMDNLKEAGCKCKLVY